MINESADFFGGQQLNQQETGEQPAVEDSLAWGHLLDTVNPPEYQSEQVAGVGGAIGKTLGRIFKRPIENAVKGVPMPGMQVDRQLMDDALAAMRKERQAGAQARRVDLEAQRQGGTPPVPIAEGAPSPRAVHGTSGEINLERAHPGAPAQDYVTLADKARQDPGQMLRMIRSADEMGDMLDAIGAGLGQEPRTHASIANDGFDYDAVAKAITQEGLANDRQLYALRTMVATLGEKAAGIARRIYQGDHSPALLLEYEKTGQQLIAFTSFTKGQVRETARALSQQNMIADTLSGNDLRALDMAIQASTGGNPDALIQSAGALVKQLDMGINPGDAFDGMMNRRTWLEAFIEMWKANNLSGFATQGYNAISSPVVMFAETASRGLAAGIGETRNALGIGSPEYYSAAEFKESLIGGFTGLAQSLQYFWHTLMTGESRLGAYGGKEVGSSAIQEKLGGLAGKAGIELSPNITEAVTTPAFRVMRSVDEGMMLPGYMAELSGLAARDGMFNYGLTGQALADHVDRMIQNPTYEIQQAALEQGRKVVMQASSSDEYNAGYFTQIGEMINKVAKGLPILQFVVPWIKTPARIIDYQIESSVLAVTHPGIWRALQEGGARGDMAAGKIVLGLGFTAALYPMVSQMKITGAGPEDPDQKAALEALGWQPYSFKVGDRYVSYRNWADPVAGSIAGIATALERAAFARQDTDVTRQIITGVGASAGYMFEASYLEGFKRIIDATGSDAKWAAYVGNVATGVVPYSGAVASMARMADMTDRARSRTKTPGFGGEKYTEDLFNSVKQDFAIRFPGIRDTVRPARYWDGEVKTPEGPSIVKTLLPMNMRNIQSDPASAELVQHGVKIREPGSRFDFGTQLIQIELLDLDGGQGLVYDKLIKDVGEMRRKAVDIVRGTFDYQRASVANQGLMLDDAIAKGAQAGNAKFWSETLLPMVQRGEVGGLEKSAREAGMNLQQFVQLLLTQQVGRAIVPQSRRKIEMPPALEFK